MATPATLRDKCFTNHFKCDLSDHITSISAIRAYFPPVPVQDGRHHEYVCFQPGAPAWENLTVEGLAHKDSIANLESWVKTAYEGGDARKNISIAVRNQAGDDVRTFDLFECLPIHYTKIDMGADGTGNATVTKLTLVIKINRIEIK